jgi:hypothetical protein
MKHLLKTCYLALTITSLLFLSCQNEDELTQQTEQIELQIDTSKLIDFKGLPVNHRFRTPVKDLEIVHDYSNLKKMYNEKRKSSFKQKGVAYKSDDELPSAEIIVEATEKRLNEFPYQENENSEKDLEMIHKDFPTLTGDEISENIDLIDEYYSQNLDYEILTDIAEDDNIQAKIASSKYQAKTDWGRFWCILTKFQSPWHIITPIATGIYFGVPIRSGEFSYIRTLISLYYSNRATGYSENSTFGYQGAANTQEDAYRHVVWSSFLAKYYYTVSSKSKRLRFSEAIGNANETCGDNDDDGKYMDFHNNRVGRKLFDDNCSYRRVKFLWWTITYGLNVPYESTLMHKAETLVKNGVFINKEGEGLSEPQTQQRIINTDRNKVVYFENK